MKIVFAGTPKFAIPALDALLHSKHEILAVYTQPDRPAGRGQKLMAPPIKEFAESQGLSVFQPETFKSETARFQLKDLNPDIFIDVACGLFIPESILKLPRYGCINIHPSLLPRWRGAAPIARAILEGDANTGVSIMQMDAGLDTGAILKQESIVIENTDTAEILAEKLAYLGAKLLLQVLQEVENGSARAAAQNNSVSTYAAKITKEEAKINWHDDVRKIERMIRAFNPWPIAYTNIDDKNLRIWQAEIISDDANNNLAFGSIVRANRDGIDVAAGNGILRLIKIQLPGKRAMHVSEILKAHQDLFCVGKILT